MKYVFGVGLLVFFCALVLKTEGKRKWQVIPEVHEIDMVNPVEPETRITYNDENTKMTAIHDSDIDSCFLTDYDPEWNLSGEEKTKISKSMPSKTIKSPIEFQRFKIKVGDVISSMCRRHKLFWMTKPRIPPKQGPIVPQPLSHHIAAHPVPHNGVPHPVPHHDVPHPVPHHGIPYPVPHHDILHPVPNHGVLHPVPNHGIPHPVPHHDVPHPVPHHGVPHPMPHHMNHKSAPYKMAVPVPDTYVVPSKREIRKDVEIAPNSDMADEYIIPPKRKDFRYQD